MPGGVVCGGCVGARVLVPWFGTQAAGAAGWTEHKMGKQRNVKLEDYDGESSSLAGLRLVGQETS